jgi:hypothetical protein
MYFAQDVYADFLNGNMNADCLQLAFFSSLSALAGSLYFASGFE